MPSLETGPFYDVFISYASEERAEVAQPLSEYLRNMGLSVWFDQFSLKLGDSLRRTIDAGLANSRFGVVILSKNFFSKHWTNLELDALAQREVEGKKVILPIWYDVDGNDVRRYSPTLADRLSARWTDGLPRVAAKIVEVVNPELLINAYKDFGQKQLHRIRTGVQLAAAIRGTDMGLLHNDEPQSADEAEFVATCLQEIQEWGESLDDDEAGDHVRAEFRLGEIVHELEQMGWVVYGARHMRRMRIHGLLDDWSWTVLTLLRDYPKVVYREGDRIVVVRKDLRTK